MDISLVILAAGIGSRFGGGVKQLAGVGPNGETIIEYTVRDAVDAGFGKSVFIIREEIRQDFLDTVGTRMERFLAKRGVKWAYVCQQMDDLPAGRTKPWGTGQAVLCCKDVLDGPFAVVNADDYYGKSAFRQAYDFCSKMEGSDSYGMMGYVLGNTVSDSGSVTRGLCTVDGEGMLQSVTETRRIARAEDGRIYSEKQPEKTLAPETLVSMNFWMFPPQVLSILESGFADFRENLTDLLLDEYLLPTIVDGLLKAGKCTVSVLPTQERWLGLTYKDDLPAVREAIRKMR